MTPDQGRSRPDPSSAPDPAHQPRPAAPAAGAAWPGDLHADLGTALDQLAQVAAASPGLEAALDRVTGLTVRAVPGADGAGVALLEAGAPVTVCVSDPFVRAVDEVQHALAEGPAVTATRENRPVASGSLGDDPSFPEFGPRARELGVHSALALPLATPDGEVTGALTLYGRRRDAFAPDAAVRAEVVATAVEVVVQNARERVQAGRIVTQLRTAMNSRATIDQAIGILMSRQGGSPEDAFSTLRRRSQNQNIKLAVLAEEIVQEAVTRARARHGGG